LTNIDIGYQYSAGQVLEIGSILWTFSGAADQADPGQAFLGDGSGCVMKINGAWGERSGRPQIICFA